MDIAREPFTEPYTIAERVSIRWSLKKYDLRRFFETGMWQSLAHKLPRRLVLFAYIRVVAEATTKLNAGPEEVTYSDAYNAWERKA